MNTSLNSMPMKLEDDLNADSSLSSFEFFAEVAVSLDPAYESIAISGDAGEYEAESFDKKMTHFSDDLKRAIKGIYYAAKIHIESRNDLAVHIFDYRELTGRTLEEVASKLSQALGKTLSRSYIFKLYHAGRLIKQVPALREVPDTEKLAQISKIENIQDHIVVTEGTVRLGEIDLKETSRGKLAQELKRSYPEQFKSSTKRTHTTEFQKAVTEDGSLLNLKSALELVLKQNVDPELAESLQSALVLVESRLPK